MMRTAPALIPHEMGAPDGVVKDAVHVVGTVGGRVEPSVPVVVTGLGYSMMRGPITGALVGDAVVVGAGVVVGARVVNAPTDEHTQTNSVADEHAKVEVPGQLVDVDDRDKTRAFPVVDDHPLQFSLLDTTPPVVVPVHAF